MDQDMFQPLQSYHYTWASGCQCVKNANKIIKMINSHELTLPIIDKFYKSLARGNNCLNNNKDYNEKIFPVICKDTIPPLGILRHIMLSPGYRKLYPCFATVLEDKKFDEKQSAIFIDASSKHPTDNKLVDFMLKHCVVGKSFFLLQNKIISDLMKSKKIVKKDVNLLSYNAVTYEDLIKEHLNDWGVNFEGICFSGSLELIDYVLNNTKTVINDTHFNSILTDKKTVMINRSKYTVSSSTDNYKPEKISILIKHGYKINNTTINTIITKYHDPEILKHIDSNIVFNNMISGMNRWSSRFDSKSFCHIIQTFGFRDDFLEQILYKKHLIHLFSSLLDCNKTFTLTPNQVKLFAERLRYDIHNEYKSPNDNSVLADTVVKFMEFNEENIYQLLKSKSKDVYQLFNKSSLSKTSLVLEGLCYGCNHCPSLIYEFMKDIEFTSKHFEGICSSGNIDMINDIYHKTRIPIEKQHFKAILSSRKIYLSPYCHSKTDISKIDPINSGLVQLFFKYGYKLEYDDLEPLIKNNIKIEEIEKYGIVADKKIYEISCENKFFLFNHFEGVDNRLVELFKIILSRGGLPKVRKFYDENKNKDLVPDKYCMEFVCRSKNHHNLYKFLVEKGGIPTYKCLKYLTENIGNQFIKNVSDDLERFNVI